MTILCWLSSYPCNRKQFVQLGKHQSEIFEVSSDVPQGSHLEPFLFLIFINDHPSVLQDSECLMFADLKVFRAIWDVSDINYICNWCRKNLVPLNIKKCCTLSFSRLNCKFNFDYTINSFNLNKVLSFKDLGVIFNSKLNFKEHIDYILAKSMRSLGFLKRNCKEFKNILTLNTLHYSLVRPHLEYCCIIWNSI